MPCYDKKLEAARDELWVPGTQVREGLGLGTGLLSWFSTAACSTFDEAPQKTLVLSHMPRCQRWTRASPLASCMSC